MDSILGLKQVKLLLFNVLNRCLFIDVLLQ